MTCAMTLRRRKPEVVPQTVTAALERYNRNHPKVVPVTPEELRFDTLCGCYSFDRNGMFHGVELDGHIHT